MGTNRCPSLGHSQTGTLVKSWGMCRRLRCPGCMLMFRVRVLQIDLSIIEHKLKTIEGFIPALVSLCLSGDSQVSAAGVYPYSLPEQQRRQAWAGGFAPKVS